MKGSIVTYVCIKLLRGFEFQATQNLGLPPKVLHLGIGALGFGRSWWCRRAIRLKNESHWESVARQNESTVK